MDQRVSRALKALKCISVNNKSHITYIDGKWEVSKINILGTMKFLLQAWHRLSKETINYCFQCAEISIKSQADALEDDGDLFRSFLLELDELELRDLTKYRSVNVKLYTTYIEDKGKVPKISILDTMKFLTGLEQGKQRNHQAQFQCSEIS